MRKIKATIGSTFVAIALCASTLMTDAAFANTVQRNAINDFSNNAYAVGDLILTEEEKQVLDESGKVIHNIKDLGKFYEGSSTRF